MLDLASSVIRFCSFLSPLPHTVSRPVSLLLDFRLCTTPSGIAASPLGGTSVHSWAGIGIGEGTPRELADKIKVFNTIIAQFSEKTWPGHAQATAGCAAEVRGPTCLGTKCEAAHV